MLRQGGLKIKTMYGGVDPDGTPSLYVIDEYGALMKPSHIAINYSMYFLLATLDEVVKPEMNKE